MSSRKDLPHKSQLKRSTGRIQKRSVSDSPSSDHARAHSKNSTLQISLNDDPFAIDDRANSSWTQQPIVESPLASASPTPSAIASPSLPSPPPHQHQQRQHQRQPHHAPTLPASIQRKVFSPKVFRSAKSASSVDERHAKKQQSVDESNNGRDKDASGQPTRTPSKVRWEQIRQHVIPVSGSAAPHQSTSQSPSASPSISSTALPPALTPGGAVAAAPIAVPGGSAIAASVLTPNCAHAPIPKPSSRLAARFGFRQVVEQVREVSVDDARRFADEVLRVCWSAHASLSGSGPASYGVPAAVAGGSGAASAYGYGYSWSATSSSATLPMSMMHHTGKSSVSLISGLTGASSGGHANANANAGVYADGGMSSAPGPARRPTLAGTLHDILLRYAKRHVTALPHEPLVLASLLGPFLMDDPSESAGAGAGAGAGVGLSLDEDRWSAAEAFELIVETWRAVTPELEISRLLWTLRAATRPTRERTRLLTVLDSLAHPRGGELVLSTPEAFLSLAQGLLLLLIALLRQPAAHSTGAGDGFGDGVAQADAVRGLLRQLASGECGALEVPGCVFKSAEEGRVVREMLLGEAVVRVMECSNGEEGEVRRYVMRYLVDEYWCPLQDTTTLPPVAQSSIARTLAAFSYAARALLDSPSTVTSSSSTSLLAKKLPDAERILHVLNTRAVPLVRLASGPRAADAQGALAKLVLALLCADFDGGGPTEEGGGGAQGKLMAVAAADLLSRAYGEWKVGVERVVGSLLAEGAWDAIVKVLRAVMRLETAQRVQFFGPALPLLIDRLVADPPPIPFPALSSVLAALSTAHPQLLFKPLFTLAQTSSDPSLPSSAAVTAFSGMGLTIAAHHLCGVAALARVVPRFWTRDPDMVLVALGGSEKKGKGLLWGRPRVGQVIILLELLARVKEVREGILRRAKEESEKEGDWGKGVGNGSGDEEEELNASIQFFSVLEAKIGIILEARTRNDGSDGALERWPALLQLLLASLLTEIRLLNRSLKRCQWYTPVTEWVQQASTSASAGNNATADKDVEEGSETVRAESVANDDELSEEESIRTALQDLQTLYKTAQDSCRATRQRRSTMYSYYPSMLAASKSSGDPNGGDGKVAMNALVDAFEERCRLVGSLQTNAQAALLRLLVVVSASLTVADHEALGRTLWEWGVGCEDSGVHIPAAFLLMLCIEKAPMIVPEVIKYQLLSNDVSSKLDSIHKINTLVSLRFQLLSQPFLPDRQWRRPFRLARDPLIFVMTDIGSSQYVREENEDDNEDGLPFELRRRLSEVGWMDDDKPADHKRDWVLTPLTLLPSHLADRGASLAGAGTTGGGLVTSGSGTLSAPPSPTSSPAKSRPNSDTSGDVAAVALARNVSDPTKRGVKRRAVFIPALAAVLPHLAVLTLDPDPGVSSEARQSITELMRNEPGLLSRPIFDLLAAGDSAQTFRVLTALLHVRTHLPHAMAHAIFNHVTGYLKYLAREADAAAALGPDAGQALRVFAASVGVLAQLVPQVSELSIREIRRAKVDMFLLPTGALWFGAGAPASALFPRRPPYTDDPAESVQSVGAVTMLRLAQNMFFLALLKRHPRDVGVIRKGMSRLSLPPIDFEGPDRYGGFGAYAHAAKTLELKDFVPKRLAIRQAMARKSSVVHGMSVALSRSYLLLLSQIFRSMSRHLSDRGELAVFIDGINRILLAHGDDTGIVVQSMIALMIASTRFRRLFITGGGYPLFMPAVIKVYAEQESHPGIRQAIEYAVNRFFALHQDAFIFQTLDVMTHVNLAFGSGDDWLTKHIFTLLSSLREDITRVPDIVGIRDVNKTQEREALLVATAEDKPQTFFAAIRREKSSEGPTQGQARNKIIVDLPEEYATKILDTDNLVRLLLTVIAHDPAIQRAQQLLRFMRHTVSPIYETSKTARSVLRDGIDALGTILLRGPGKPKTAVDPSGGAPVTADELGDGESSLTETLQRKSKAPSDFMAMRVEYLFLSVEFLRAGGHYSIGTTQKILDVVKLLLRDAAHLSHYVATFLGDLSVLSLQSADRAKDTINFLRDLAPIVSAYASALDFSAVYKAITDMPWASLSQERGIANLVVTQIIRAALSATEDMPISLGTDVGRSPLVGLLVRSLSYHGNIVMDEIVRNKPTFKYLISVVFPFAISLQTTSWLMQQEHHIESWRLDNHRKAWVQLLTYVMTACQGASAADGRRTVAPSDQPRGSIKRRPGNPRDTAMTIAAALQVLKVVVIRGQDDLARISGIWIRVSNFVHALIREGDARFASSGSTSVPPSPTHSPRNSFSDHSPPLLPLRRGDSIKASSPRAVDYVMWSFLELLCRCRHPIALQMKLLMQEKTLQLNHQIRATHGAVVPSDSRRASMTIFSKPRHRVSNASFGQLSPRSSAFPTSASNLSLHPHNVRMERGRLSEAHSYASLGGERIVHLGPGHQLAPEPLQRATSVERSASVLASGTKVRAPPLVRATYRRIRLVQMHHGYTPLLAYPLDLLDLATGEEESPRSWALHEAMDAMIKETKELVMEFANIGGEVDEDVVVVTRTANDSIAFDE
ncbi:hypothetical protein CONPUDRAFT_108623 [Coniophora puteana RWD-64-598 SS2]|uniref:Protein UNC80 C-terminal domain-containing protein n=1 Tax=Coniophora puteana (strain RWD-64-598) TaxID=741705 RepID=A0A5M3MHG7_CONPW|nr:uncharacterized protein CONPUDRAFT_108623 [Coniophora puteana RWD-64-598 SS2]EIW78652.1 hypothetical protein CONPUDRAFT_108623 [Coniophora puteana RWD-64-598 SS2]